MTPQNRTRGKRGVVAEGGYGAETIFDSAITMRFLTSQSFLLTPNFSWVCNVLAIPFNRFNGF